MNIRKIIIICVCLVVIIFTGLFFVSKNRQSSYSGPIQKVNLQLKWKHQAQFAGHYTAIEKGFYKNEGLDVSVKPYEYNESVVDTVVSGKADFATGAADEIVFARSKGIPVKAIAVIYRINPITAYTLKTSGINKPQDFVGKKVGIEKSANVEYLYKAMMSKLGIDRSKIKEVPMGYNADELINGTVDVATGYITNEPNLAIESGHPVNTILMADYGVDMYADVLFTTEKMINEKPDLVERFLRATIKGWQYSLENEQEAVDITMHYANSNREHELSMLRTSAPLIHTGSANLGSMDLAGWENVQNILISQKLLASPIDMDDAFTTKFIDKIYNN